MLWAEFKIWKIAENCNHWIQDQKKIRNPGNIELYLPKTKVSKSKLHLPAHDNPTPYHTPFLVAPRLFKTVAQVVQHHSKLKPSAVNTYHRLPPHFVFSSTGRLRTIQLLGISCHCNKTDTITIPSTIQTLPTSHATHE